MAHETYKVVFKYENLGLYEMIPGIKGAMEHEFMKVYNIYAKMANSGITDELNRQFDILHPTYHEDNKGKEWYELTEYNQFMADGYNNLIVKLLNDANMSMLLDFFVDPNEIAFKGRLKRNHNVTMEFFLKKA